MQFPNDTPPNPTSPPYPIKNERSLGSFFRVEAAKFSKKVIKRLAFAKEKQSCAALATVTTEKPRFGAIVAIFAIGVSLHVSA